MIALALLAQLLLPPVADPPVSERPLRLPPPAEVTQRIASWDALTYPLLIGHRGNAQGAPENTIEGFSQAADMGVPLETDAQATFDNLLVLMHDSTVDRTTDLAGSVAQFRMDQIRYANAAAKFQPAAGVVSSSAVPIIGTAFYNREPVPTFEDYLRFASRVPLIPEVKDGLDATATLMAQKVVALGLQRAVVIASFTLSNLSAVRAVDPAIKTLLYATGSTPNLTTTAAAGVWGLGYDNALVTSAAVVTAAHAAGFKLFAWTLDDIDNADLMVTRGADGVITDDPAYLKHYYQGGTLAQPSTVLAPVGTLTSGWRTIHNKAPNATTVISGGYVTFAGTATTAPVSGDNYIVIPGVKTKSAASSTGATYSITFNVKITTASADTTRWVGIRFGCNGDTGTGVGNLCGANGYHALYRQNGSAELFTVTGGTSSSIGVNQTWSTYTTGATFQLKITATATGFTFTRVDTAQTNTVSDATYDKAGYASISTSGLVPGLATVALQ